MKRSLILILIMFAGSMMAIAIPQQQAMELALERMHQLYPQHRLSNWEVLGTGAQELAYVFHLQPSGYLVISAREELPPVLAYSGSSSFHGTDGAELLSDLVLADLSKRLQSTEEAERNRLAWQNLNTRERFQQWPPAGYSPTEGWLKTNWTQSAPYNWMVPLDQQTQTRSYAGCPAIAMGQIVNFHAALNGTRFNDGDDYHHNYGSQSYWIDDDFATLDFPSFPVLNGYLDEINRRYRYQEELSDSLKAALVFACGTACTQVYASGGSGTFGVNQAFAAFQRFNFPQAALLTETAPDLYPRMESNVKNALPVHLAVVDQSWSTGHNVVVDGYNTDNFYHLNFGWGGQYNGWYLLPSQIPYNLTVVEGAIVDIAPYMYAMSVPDTLDFSQQLTQPLEIVNLGNTPITVENILLHNDLDPDLWTITPATPLPAVIPVNGVFTINISFSAYTTREIVLSGLRLILDQTAMEIPLRYDNATAIQDQQLPCPVPELKVSPNPFFNSARLSVKTSDTAATEISIYNLKGQRIKAWKLAANNQGEITLEWDGRNDAGQSCGSGVYLVRCKTGSQAVNAKLLHLK